MKKRILSLIIALLAVVVLVGCKSIVPTIALSTIMIAISIMIIFLFSISISSKMKKKSSAMALHRILTPFSLFGHYLIGI